MRRGAGTTLLLAFCITSLVSALNVLSENSFRCVSACATVTGMSAL